MNYIIPYLAIFYLFYFFKTVKTMLNKKKSRHPSIQNIILDEHEDHKNFLIFHLDT